VSINFQLTHSQAVYRGRPRKDDRNVNLISDALRSWSRASGGPTHGNSVCIGSAYGM